MKKNDWKVIIHEFLVNHFIHVWVSLLTTVVLGDNTINRGFFY